MRTSVVRSVVVAVVALVIPASVFAGPVVTDFDGGGAYESYWGSITGDVVGFRFTADAALTIRKLGVYANNDGVLNSSHQVGLWRDSDQVLLGTIVVDPATGQLIDGFMYEDLGTPISLVEGARYTLGALYAEGSGDKYVANWSSVSLSGISSTVAVCPAERELGFVYPATETSSYLARLGPNAFADAVGVVPVPASLLLAGLGAGLVARFRGRIRGN